MKSQTHAVFVIFAIAVLFSAASVFAQMSGGVYEIYADSVSYVGGSDGTTSATGRIIYDAGSGLGISTSTGGTYELRAGFQAQEQGILSFTLDTATINFGTLSSTTVSTQNVVITISTDSETGYTLSLTEDGNLRSGVNEIADVIDGSVTAGSEEYGIVVSGNDAISTTTQAIAGTVNLASATGTITGRQTTVQFQAAVSSSTTDAAYSHTVTFSATVNP